MNQRERNSDSPGRTPKSDPVRQADQAMPSPHIDANEDRQREAKARLKDTRIKEAGIESRQMGHTSGSVKRSQARRDSKNG